MGICEAVKIDNRLKFNQFRDDKLTVPIKRKSVYFILSFLGDCFLVLMVVTIAVFIGFITNMI